MYIRAYCSAFSAALHCFPDPRDQTQYCCSVATQALHDFNDKFKNVAEVNPDITFVCGGCGFGTLKSSGQPLVSHQEGLPTYYEYKCDMHCGYVVGLPAPNNK